jgi:hypothetical protein
MGRRAVSSLSWLALSALAISACADPPECDLTPDTTTYNCEPIASGSGCMGGPSWSDGTARQDDADKLFPIGCGAQIPACSSFYKGSRRSFSCDGGGWAEAL